MAAPQRYLLLIATALSLGAGIGALAVENKSDCDAQLTVAGISSDGDGRGLPPLLRESYQRLKKALKDRPDIALSSGPLGDLISLTLTPQTGYGISVSMWGFNTVVEGVAGESRVIWTEENAIKKEGLLYELTGDRTAHRRDQVIFTLSGDELLSIRARSQVRHWLGFWITEEEAKL